MKMPIGAGRVVARLYMALALGLFDLNCFCGGYIDFRF
jgi:hypothetical protein